MAKTYISIKTRVDAQKDRINDITNLIGDISLLTTGDTAGGDSDLVTAILELDSDIGPRPNTNLTTTAKNLTDAINEIDAELGDIGSMTTTASTVGPAINELDSDIGPNPSSTLTTTSKNLTDAINEIDSDVGDRSSLAAAISNTSSLVLAINSIQTVLGSAAFSGVSATTVKGAINEIVAELGDVTALTTDASVAVLAINELDSDVGALLDLDSAEIDNRTSLVDAINEVAATANLALDSAGAAGAKIGLLADLFTVTKTDIVAAINEIAGGFIDSARDAMNAGQSLDYDSASGTFSVTNNGIGTTQLNISGTGTALQTIVSDADGSMSWGLKVPSVYDSDGTLLNG